MIYTDNATCNAFYIASPYRGNADVRQLYADETEQCMYLSRTVSLHNKQDHTAPFAVICRLYRRCSGNKFL